MKITKKELASLIQEEIKNQKRIKILENRKSQILNLLKEINECGVYEEKEEMMNEVSDEMIEEILGKLFGKTSSEEKRKIMADFIHSHPTYSQVAATIAQKYGKNEQEIEDKLIDFFVKEGSIVNGKLQGIKSSIYDPKTGMFVNKTKVSVPYGPMGGTGEL